MGSIGSVTLVGAGSGGWDLITVRGLRALSQASVVVYDNLIDRRLLRFAVNAVELVYAGKRPGKHAMTQDEINSILVDRALKGHRVVRLKGGDPLTFGRGEEECDYVARMGIPCSIIPGVTSYNAAAARIGLPLAGREAASNFIVTTGVRAGGARLDRDSISKIIGSAHTAVFLMSTRILETIVEEAGRKHGMPPPVLAVSKLGYPDEQIVWPDRFASERPPKIEPPSVIFVGGSVRWLEKRRGYYRLV
ncbi:MAG: uroporphyrinogen-III C-methyltransferase [Desulfurococcales archaeon]|nr:uroporphyrinogen-III C-methyltransferase [Desulfurococcales archaeon]